MQLVTKVLKTVTVKEDKIERILLLSSFYLKAKFSGDVASVYNENENESNPKNQVLNRSEKDEFFKKIIAFKNKINLPTQKKLLARLVTELLTLSQTHDKHMPVEYLMKQYLREKFPDSDFTFSMGKKLKNDLYSFLSNQV